MAQVCGTCNRSWDDRATFCGACGDRLDASLARPAGRASPGRARLPTGLLWSALAVSVVVITALAVPAIQIERSTPVPGDVGVPDTDDLQAAGPADAGVDDGEEQTDASRPVPPPNVSCTRDETPVGCVLWVRRMFDPRAAGGRGLQTRAVDDLLLTVEGHLVRGLDTATGRQQWQREFGRPVELIHADDGVGIIHLGGLVQAISLDDAEVVWTADAIGPVHGPIISHGLVYTAGVDEEGPKLVARSVEDGSVTWEASTGERDFFNVVDSSDHGVLVSTYDNELVFFDRETGEQRWQRDGQARMLDVRDDVLVFVEADGEQDPEAPNRAGDPGATVRGIDLVTGELRWERTVPALEVPFVVQADLLLAPSSGLLTAVDVATGQARWTVEVTERERAAYGPVSPTSESSSATVVTFSEESGTIRGRDPASGTVAWEYQPSSGGFGYAMRQDGLALVPTPGGMDVIDLDTGAQQLRVHAGEDLHPVGAGPELLVDHRSGYAVRLDLSSPSALRGFP